MIDVSNLTYTYPGGEKVAVQGVDFRIDKGEIFGFLGPSGAGKSTTQKILIKLLRGYSGEIAIFDKPLSRWDDSYYERVGVAFELPNHYRKLTGLENLTLFRSLYSGPTQDPMTLLEMVGLKDDANLRVANYSKGMQMRLNFVRALLHQPELLFLDEPTTGLDPVNGRNIRRIIGEQKEAGRTVFLTTHDRSYGCCCGDSRAGCTNSNRLSPAPNPGGGERLLQIMGLTARDASIVKCWEWVGVIVAAISASMTGIFFPCPMSWAVRMPHCIIPAPSMGRILSA